MFLLDRIGFLSLLGLLLQALLTWMLVVIFVALHRGSSRPAYFRTWTWALAALAVGLTVLGARFLFAFESEYPHLLWQDGEPIAQIAYTIYQTCKGVFGILLVKGTYELAGQRLPRRWRLVMAAVLVGLAASPWLIPGIELLLALQAPFMIACSAGAWWVLWRALPQPRASGVRMVRLVLAGMAVVWLVHAVNGIAKELGAGGVWTYLIAFNSYLDLALELPLATGLIVIQMQDANHRLQQAQDERARLQERVSRDARLSALGTLVSGVAHELNNPLTAILGYADDLGPGGDPCAARIVREQAERCCGIVRSLSALAGQCAHPFAPVSCRELVLRVARGFARQLDEAGVALDLRIEPVATIVADGIGLEQVLTNLLANAVQASRRGAAVTVSLRQDGAMVELAVADRGPGIPVEQRDRLFEPFFTTKAPGAGTGLGLALVHGIVRGHGGTIDVEPGGDGCGARFVVRLPLQPRVAAAPAPPEPAPRAVAPRRLLVVDDEAAVRDVVARHARRRGWEVMQADSAEAALAQLADADGDDVDAVLCDLRMPGMGGVALHDHLAHQAPHLLARCVFFSGDMASAETARFAARCRQPLAAKPFDFALLFRELDGVAHAVAWSQTGADSRP